MAFTYNIDLSTPKDLVRFYIQDTIEDDVFFQDEEINAMIKKYKDPLRVAVECCYSLSALFAGMPDTESLGPYKVKYESMSDKYSKLAETLRRKANRCSPIAVGGVTKAQINNNRRDNSIVEAAFKRNMMKYININTINNYLR